MKRILLIPLLIATIACTKRKPQICGLQASMPTRPAIKTNFENNATSVKVKKEQVSITLSRGAFHYDKFVLANNVITFIPPKNKMAKAKYNVKSSVTLTDKEVKEVVKMLKDANVFALKNKYKTNWSCASMLHVDIKIGDQSISIKCEDWKHSPEVLQKLEDKLVEFHGKDLKRVILPG